MAVELVNSFQRISCQLSVISFDRQLAPIFKYRKSSCRSKLRKETFRNVYLFNLVLLTVNC